VMVAHDGQEAIEAIARRVPDLLLLDIMMPRLSGYDVCQKIRESEAWRDIRIVMLSAKGREVEIAKGLALGADAYVTKPFSTRELLTQIHALLGD
jgi:DNA-binding response OmpR family regulator